MALRVIVFGPEDIVQSLQAAGMTGGALRFVAADPSVAGLPRLQSEDFDGIVVCLPTVRTSPQQLCEQIRAVSKLPMVVLAEEADADTVVEVLAWGVDECLPANLSGREIVTHLRAQIRRATEYVPEALVPEEFQVGSLYINVPRHVATLGDESLDLTPKEFELLAYLARHPGRVMPREQIIADVWNEQLNAASRSLDVHIGRLRRKIETDPRNPKLLTTVAGVGYCLQVN